jgi:hypothetical protein
MKSFDALRNYLVDTPPGRFSKTCTLEVESFLASAWDHFAGSHDGGMTAEKLRGRTEGLEWSPPRLLFNIERHTETGNHSTRAAVQHWEVDLDQGTAALIGNESGQIIPMDRHVDVVSIAATELATAINEQREDPRIEWVAMNCVRIFSHLAIPATKGTTTIRRRRRFVAEIKELLRPLDWRLTSTNPLIFEQQTRDFSETDYANLDAAPPFPESLAPEVVNLGDRRRLSTPFPSHVGGLSESRPSTFGSWPMDAQMECTPTNRCGRLTCEDCSDPQRLRWISKTLAIAKSFPGQHERATVFLGMVPADLGIPLVRIGHDSLRLRLKVANIEGPLLRGGIDVTWASAPDQWLLYAHALAIGVPPEAWARLRGIVRMTQPSYFNPDLLKVQRLHDPEKQIPDLVKFHTYFWPRSPTGPARAVPLPAHRLEELTDWGSNHSFKETTFELKQKRGD